MLLCVTETYQSIEIKIQPDITIGITGGIGSGKSVVSRILRCNGFYVYDCDTEAKRLMIENLEVKNALIDNFGNQIYTSEGNLNRQYLSTLIFENENMRGIVNGIVHKAVRDDIKRKRELINGFLFIESAIINTGGLDKYCNRIWLVESDHQERISRLKQRDGLSHEEVLSRIKSQEREFENIPSEKLISIKNDSENSIILKIIGLLKV